MRILKDTINKAHYTGLILTVGDKTAVFPTYDDITMELTMSYSISTFNFEPNLRQRWLIMANEINKLLIDVHESHQFDYYGIDATIELLVYGEQKFIMNTKVPGLRVATASYILADLITHLAATYSYEPKLKYIVTGDVYNFVNSNVVNTRIYDNKDRYTYSLQFTVPNITYEDSELSFILARDVHPYEVSTDKISGIISTYEFSSYGEVIDGNKYFIISYGNTFIPLNAWYEFATNPEVVELRLLGYNELSKDEIDNICEFHNRRNLS